MQTQTSQPEMSVSDRIAIAMRAQDMQGRSLAAAIARAERAIEAAYTRDERNAARFALASLRQEQTRRTILA
jgi:hypothetical protein